MANLVSLCSLLPSLDTDRCPVPRLTALTGGGFLDVPGRRALLASARSVAGKGRSRRQEDGEIREYKNGQTTLHA